MALGCQKSTSMAWIARENLQVNDVFQPTNRINREVSCNMSTKSLSHTTLGGGG